MSAAAFVAILAGVVLFLYAVLIYNGLVNLKHGMRKAWSNIDVLLKQRHEELPKLVEVCRQYMTYEQDALARVIEARAAVSSARERGDIESLGNAETGLRKGLFSLLALAEAYPDLKANEHFGGLRERISQLENAIADRRELYNEAVNLNNARIEQFPDLLIARALGFRSGRLLSFAAGETENVDLQALFRR